MKKAIIISILVLCAMTAMAQEPQLKQSSLYAYGMASAWSSDKFSSTNGAVKLGTGFSIDASKGLFLRTGFASFNVAGPNIEALEVLPTLNWYIGQKWTFYLLGGITGYVSGENNGIDGTGGFGVSRRLWTAKQGFTTIPANLSLYGEIILIDDADIAQVNVGFVFGKAE